MSTTETPAVVDGTAEELPTLDQPAPEHPGAGTAIARRERRSEVIRPLDTDALVESFAAYQQLLPRLLVASDYQDAGRGKQFVKKSGWRKIASAFDLDVVRVSETVERDEHGQPVRAMAVYRAIAPSGRSMDGDGYCSVDEDRFSGPRGNKTKLENDLRATATTRAKNRAISDLVGMGEVSAEEVSATDTHAGPPPSPWGQAAADELLERTRKALGYLTGHPPESPDVTVFIDAIKLDCGGFVSGPVCDGIVRAAVAAAKAHKGTEAPA